MFTIPHLKNFVPDGECGRVILSTLLPVGAKAGNLLLNYDTEDTTVVLTRKTVPLRKDPYENHDSSARGRNRVG